MAPWLVTGSTRGIGLELCRQLHGRGEAVIAVCRSASPELQNLGVRIEAGVELTSETAIAALADRLAKVALNLATSGTFRHANGEALPW